jgi:hypothetical protein
MLNRSSKNMAVKNAWGIVLVGLLPLGCTAFIKPIFYLQKLQAVKKQPPVMLYCPAFSWNLIIEYIT